MRCHKALWWLLQTLSLLPLMATKEYPLPTKKFYIEPEFDRPIGNHTFYLGKEAVLSCAVKNLGNHNLGWLRDDYTVLSMNHRAIISTRYSTVKEDDNTWQLRIRPLKAEDKGCYICQINSRPHMKWQSGCFDVYVPPDILGDETSGEVSVAEFDNATLTCKPTGNPLPRVTWRREDHAPILLRKRLSKEFNAVETYMGASMPLFKVDRRQMGVFLCIASNEVPPSVSKRITLNVNFAPIVTVPNQLLGAPLGTDVELRCSVEAFPNTINFWIKNRGEMLLDGPKYTIIIEKTLYKVSMWLVIKQFSEKDIATYNCISTNSLGRAEGTIRLYEIKLSTLEDLANQISKTGGASKAGKENASSKRTQWTLLYAILFNVLGLLL